MWTDTHLHLDASEYYSDRLLVVERARAVDVNRFVLPAVCAANFLSVKNLAHQIEGAFYCLGIHPLFVATAKPQDLTLLKETIQANIDDPKFVGVGEIGLDGFIDNPNWTQQTEYFNAQLALARDFDLPVIVHVRKSQDLILKGLRHYKPQSGIAHAFNGSAQQADQFIKLNMCLGFGGACTFTRANQIRRLAASVPLDYMVLETDGPDIPPEWINHKRNEPVHLPRIAQLISTLRNIELMVLSRSTQANVDRVLSLTEVKQEL
jgi:TatD DNase family protein